LDNNDGNTIESNRAKELNEMFGPKRLADDEHPQADFIIDLHSSTANVGKMIMISDVEHDVYTKRLIYRMQEHYQSSFLSSSASVLRPFHVTNSPVKKLESYSTDSICPSGFGIKVGPLAHGTLDYALYQENLDLLDFTLNTIEERNLQLLNTLSEEKVLPVTRCVLPVVSTLLPTHFPSLEYYERIGDIYYPNIEDGFEINQIPRSHMIHPRWKDADWQVIEEGDPLFIPVLTETHQDVFFEKSKYLYKEQAKQLIEENVPIYVVFVGEAAYETRHLAITLYKKTSGVVF
jgi:aspartoacylase